jgi:uncharacterized membrane protein
MRVVIALPFHGLLGILAVLLMPFFMFSFVEVLRAVGMHPLAALLLGASVTFLSLATSPVNLVVYTLSRRQYMPVVDYVVVFGIPVPVPRIVFREEKSYIAINVGGAVIPLAVATYLAAHVFSPALLAAVAIIGADVLNMGKVLRYRPPFVSIGGAGVFDGIFLSGVLAVLLSRLF